MKLTLMRHADAMPAKRLNDFARPLSTLGHTQAFEAAEDISITLCDVDLVMVSPAQRTKETWKHVATKLNNPGLLVIESMEIYSGNYNELLNAIEKQIRVTASKHCLVIGHNPTISYIASMLGGARSQSAEGFAPSTMARFEGNLVDDNIKGSQWLEIAHRHPNQK